MNQSQPEKAERGIEEIMRECDVLFDGIELAKSWFRKQITGIHQSHHQELQKARHDWLREEIVKLEGMKVCTDAGRADPGYYHCENTRDGTLQTIIDRYQSELDQPNK